MVMSGGEPHRFLIHDHDSIYSEEVDRTITAVLGGLRHEYRLERVAA
jgi:hypothetical protein